jgi:hypothetical protein
LEHDLFRKAVPTFRDHASGAGYRIFTLRQGAGKSLGPPESFSIAARNDESLRRGCEACSPARDFDSTALHESLMLLIFTGNG